MKKNLLLIPLLLGPTFAQAEWVKMHENSATIFYIDPATIHKSGNFRKIWEVKNFKVRDPGGEMSVRFLSEYDCKKRHYRVLTLTSHSDPMACGQIVVWGDDPSQWVAIPPDSLGELTLKIVCAK